MKQKTGYMTTRKQYKEAKTFNHDEFDRFCTNIYTAGFKDGQNAVPSADYNDVMAAIRTVKGIGEKRMEQIEAAVAPLFKR